MKDEKVVEVSSDILNIDKLLKQSVEPVDEYQEQFDNAKEKRCSVGSVGGSFSNKTKEEINVLKSYCDLAIQLVLKKEELYRELGRLEDSLYDLAEVVTSIGKRFKNLRCLIDKEIVKEE